MSQTIKARDFREHCGPGAGIIALSAKDQIWLAVNNECVTAVFGYQMRQRWVCGLCVERSNDGEDG